VQSGRHGRIGFAVFAWHHGHFPAVVSWTLIAAEEDARQAARAIEARLAVDIEREARDRAAFYAGRLTGLTRAIDHARGLLAQAPFEADRAVVNIIGNGQDNVGGDADLARDRLVALGGTINGVVLGEDLAVLDYYRTQVIGGPGAFLLSMHDPATMADVLRKKFVLDIAMRVPLDPLPTSGG
jgi:Ca-activated chloride channel homolog